MSRREDGSASVLVVALVAVLGLVGGALVSVALAVVARHRADAASDLAALAAAGRALDGQAAACAAAREVALGGGGRVVVCRLVGGTAVVTVEVRPPGRLAVLGPARSTARAGPATATGTADRPRTSHSRT